MVQVLDRVGRVAVTKPNWERAVTVDYEFKTEIHSHYDGTEEREALRETARVGLQFNTVLTRPGVERHMADLADDQTGLFVVPTPWRNASLASEAASGQAFVELASVPFWCVAGATVVLSDGVTEEAATVDSVSGSNVVLSDNLSTTFSAGAKLYHAYSARTQDTTRFRAETASLWTGQMRYNVDPGSDPQAYPVASPATFEDREVFLTRPNWREAPNNEFENMLDRLDPGRGRIHLDAPRTDHVLREQLGFNGMTPTETEALIAFFLRHKGRRGAFWMPTATRDITPRIDAASGSNLLEIEGTDFRAAFENSSVYQVLIAFDGAAYQINRISTFATTASDHTLLTMASNWSFALTPETRLHWLPLWRSATDTLSVEHLTAQVASLGFTLQTVQQ